MCTFFGFLFVFEPLFFSLKNTGDVRRDRRNLTPSVRGTGERVQRCAAQRATGLPVALSRPLQGGPRPSYTELTRTAASGSVAAGRLRCAPSHREGVCAAGEQSRPLQGSFHQGFDIPRTILRCRRGPSFIKVLTSLARFFVAAVGQVSSSLRVIFHTHTVIHDTDCTGICVTWEAFPTGKVKHSVLVETP